MAAQLVGRRVLIVEDEYFIADEMRRAFEDEGAEVLGPVGRVDEALALLGGAASLDGAVLDVYLDNEMVFPLADALLQKGIPFVFTTGYDQAALPEQYSVVDRLEKPVEAATVIRAMRRLLGIK